MPKYSMVQKLTLTNRQRKELIQLHRGEQNRRFADRIKAVLLLDDGYSHLQVAQIFLLDDQTIRN